MRDTDTIEGAPQVSVDTSHLPLSNAIITASDTETSGVNLLRQYEEVLTSAISPHIRNLNRKRTNSRFGRAFSFQRNGNLRPENMDTHVAVSSPRTMQSAVVHHSPRAFEDSRPDLATFSPRRRAMTNGDETFSPTLIHEIKMTFEEKKECDEDEDKADTLSVGSTGRQGSKSKLEGAISEDRAFSNAEIEGCLICMDDFSARRKAYPLPCLGQCTGALVHYRCIMAWLGQSGSCPLCRGICDPLVLQPLQKLELQDIDRTALHPIPLDAGIIRCYVKQVYRGLFKQYGYELYLQAQAGTQDEDRFLLAARRQLRSNMTANYTIFTDKNCIKRIGRMGSNFLGTCFTMYDNGRDPQKIAKIQDAVTEEAAQNVFQIREELGCITYEPNRTSIGPRKMRVVIPSVDENSSSKIVRPMSRQDRLVHRLQSGDYRDLMRFSNREPVFREDLGAYCLDFGGRVSMASVKNFQLINSEDPSMGNILQFGRVADDMFTMDFQWPLSPFQATFMIGYNTDSYPIHSLDCANEATGLAEVFTHYARMSFAKTPLELVFLGNSALRRICEPVVDWKCPAIKQLVEAMRKQVVSRFACGRNRLKINVQIQHDGVGIAAPQLGQSMRIFLMSMDESNASAFNEIINPKITYFSKETEKDFEGCLSVPHYSGIVARSREIHVQYSTNIGKTETCTLRGFPARVFQHEMDHLDGVLFLDKVERGSFMHNKELEAMEWTELEALLDNTM